MSSKLDSLLKKLKPIPDIHHKHPTAKTTLETPPPAIDPLDEAIKELETGPSCQECHKNIHGNVVKIVEQENVAYHPDCFRCKTCCRPLAGKVYILCPELNCEQCYNQYFAKPCQACGGKIGLGEASVELPELSAPIHANCFLCAHCGLKLDKYFPKDERCYCKDCFGNLFAAHCLGCQGPIFGDYIQTNDSWHPECFNCGDCKKSLVNQTFFPLDNQVYCNLHYHMKMGLVCAGCDGMLTGGKCVALKDDDHHVRWHPTCFKCTWCSQPLTESSNFHFSKKIYCRECWIKVAE